MIVLAAVVFLCSSNLYIKTKPQGSPIVETARTVYVAISERGFENAKPSSLSQRGRLEKYSVASSANYTDQSVDGVKKGIRACKVMKTQIIGYIYRSLTMENSSSSSSRFISFVGSRSGITLFLRLVKWLCTALRMICCKIWTL